MLRGVEKNGVMLEKTWRNTGERLVRNLGVSGRVRCGKEVTRKGEDNQSWIDKDLAPM
jgi:hypothetical protein